MKQTVFAVVFAVVFACAGTCAADSGSGRLNDAAAREVLSLEGLQSHLGLKVLTEPWSGDLGGMEKRRVIRVLTVYGLGTYYLDGPQEKGIVYDQFKEYEAKVNKDIKSDHLTVYVLFIPVKRDELLPGLLSGRGDIAAAGLTITPEREDLVDFSMPVTKVLNEILVTGPAAPPINSLDDLAGQTVFVRPSSSYYSSLQTLSLNLQAQGKSAIDIQPVSETLEDVDLLEMVNAGMLPWVVVDDYKASIWSPVFKKLVARPDLILRSEGRMGYAFRKDSPQLAASLNEFLQTHREGTMMGNMFINRHFRDFDWVSDSLTLCNLKRFKKAEVIFKKYGEQYGFDYLMVAAQGFQESKLDQAMRSKAGAVGVMQLLPSTAADPNVGIPDIYEEDANIHAGIKYLDFIRTRYFNDPQIDMFNRTFLAFASYNAGPARVQGLRKKAREQGLDANVWFENVERVAAREIGQETVQYVANIFKYYIAYRVAATRELDRARQRESEGLEAARSE